MDFNWDAIDKAIYGMKPERYKAYFLQTQSSKLSQIDSIAKKDTFNKTAYDLAQRNVKYSTADLLIFYRHMMKSAYRRVNNISFENRQPLSKPAKPDSRYYGFLKELKYNDG